MEYHQFAVVASFSSFYDIRLQVSQRIWTPLELDPPVQIR